MHAAFFCGLDNDRDQNDDAEHSLINIMIDAQNGDNHFKLNNDEYREEPAKDIGLAAVKACPAEYTGRYGFKTGGQGEE